MTKTIASQTTNRHYFLTIDGSQATECSCPDRQYRHHECKPRLPRLSARRVLQRGYPGNCRWDYRNEKKDC